MAWLIVGGFYTLGYVTKVIEVTLIALLVIDLYRRYGEFGGLVHEGVPVRCTTWELRSPPASA